MSWRWAVLAAACDWSCWSSGACNWSSGAGSWSSGWKSFAGEPGGGCKHGGKPKPADPSNARYMAAVACVDPVLKDDGRNMIRLRWPGRASGTMTEEGAPGDLASLKAAVKESEADIAFCEGGSRLPGKRGGRAARALRDVMSANTKGHHGNLFTVIGLDVDSCWETVRPAIGAAERRPCHRAAYLRRNRQGFASVGGGAAPLEAPSIGGGAPAGQLAKCHRPAGQLVGRDRVASDRPARAAQDVNNDSDADAVAGTFSSFVFLDSNENASRPSRGTDVPDTNGETYSLLLIKGISFSSSSGRFAAPSGKEIVPPAPAAGPPKATPRRRPPLPVAKAAKPGDRDWRGRHYFSPAALGIIFVIAELGTAGDNLARLGDLARDGWERERRFDCLGVAGALLRSLLPQWAANFIMRRMRDDQLKQTLLSPGALIAGIRPWLLRTSEPPEMPAGQPTAGKPADEPLA